jgi:hypothetical protein
MRYLILSIVFMLSGCATLPVTDYIKADHPYERKIYASFEKVTSAAIFILHQKGWSTSQGVDPAVFEQDERYENNASENVLIFTDIKRHFRLFYSTYTHLNILVHGLGSSCNVEIRFCKLTPLGKQFITVRNDRLAQNILDAVEQEVTAHP